jgi:hypothetical protein
MDERDFIALNNMIKLEVALSHWIEYDWNRKESHPPKYDKYLICRKDGKIHWETWNGSGWAYNHKEIGYWAVIVPPNKN